MRYSKNNFDYNSLITLKDDLWFNRQRHAGKCVQSILKESGKLIKDKTPNLSLKDLEQLTALYTRNMDCSPTFHLYKNFPGLCCISVNKQLVHGIPSDYILQDGDVVSVDVGATFEGAIADAARTWIYGEPKSKEHVRLLNTCKEALSLAIKAVEVEKHIGIIGYTIYNHVKNSGFGLITNYGGHHLSYDIPHDETFVANKSGKFDGHRLQVGETIAIEPMVTIGNPDNCVDKDGWTVMTPNGIGCHEENTIIIREDGVYNITEYSE